MKIARRLLAALACVAACQAALADRSRIEDETDVVERGDCEVETALERRAALDAPPEREATLRLGCGIGWRTELAATVARRRSEGQRDAAIGFEAKTALRERGIGRLGWALAYGVGAERDGGRRWRHGDHFVAVETTFAPDRAWLIETRLGFARDRLARNDRTLWSLTVERSVSESVEALAELDGDDRERPLASVGLRWLFWPEHALATLSYGGRTGPLRERRLGLGITLEF